jgi:hypothetical protein
LRSCSALTRAIPAGGAYVRVVDDGANGFIPSYQLRAEFFSDGGTESEPNDTHGSADPVGNQAFVTGSFITDSEADVYSFSVPEGASVRLETIEAAVGNPNFETCESNDMDTIIDLLDSAGNVMATDDDGGRGRCSMIDGRGGAPNSYPPLNAPLASNLDAGTYYVRVIPYDGGFVSAFDYRLAVSIE